MSRGSVLLYSRSVVHRGGQNRADSSRLGMNITYCLAWLRQEENQYLAVPPDVARTLEPDLQELLGYTMANYALRYYGDLRPPELALGRKPRTGLPDPQLA